MASAAPDLQTLYDFEGQFEKSAQAVLTAAGVLSYIERSKKQLPTINTGISFNAGAAIDELTLLPLAPNQQPPPWQEYFRYQGELEFSVEVPRDTERSSEISITDFLAQIRGLIRGAFMLSQQPFRDDVLPYYRVSDLRPNGSITGLNIPRNSDSVILKFAVTFAIQPTAWPAGFPSS
jgi:hypothetical protein